MSVLEVRGLYKNFGGLQVLRDVGFSVEDGEIVGVLGPNGAGKTTLFNILTGLYKPSSGTITFQGEEIGGLSPHKICQLGMARTFQIVRPFHSLTVSRNVEVAAIFGSGHLLSESQAKTIADDILGFVDLRAKANESISTLTLAEVKRIEVARALATRPTLILLDETFAGLTAVETKRALALIRQIRREMGIAVLWIEHVMKAIMNTVDRLIVLDYGKKIADGLPDEIRRDPQVIKAYLGPQRTADGPN